MSRSTTNRFRPVGEALDGRLLMAAGVTANIVGNVLLITGTEANDSIQVSYSATPPNPRWGGLGTGSAVITVDGVWKLRATRFQGIIIQGRGGDDLIAINQIGRTSLLIGIDAGAGNDVVVGGPGGEVLYGNEGNDVLWGAGGPDTLIGGGGLDLVNGVGEAPPPPPVAPIPVAPPPVAPTPSVRVTPTPTPQVVVPTASNDLSTLSQQVVVYANAERQKGGLAALRVNPKLSQMAQLHAQAMAQADRLEHTLTGAALPDLRSRAGYVGYSFATLGENIAFNYRDASTLTYAWMSSPGHRQNLMNPDFTEIGVGVARNAAGQLYFCQVLGRPL